MKTTTLAAVTIALALPFGVAQAAQNDMQSNDMMSNSMQSNDMSSGMQSNDMQSNEMGSSNQMSSDDAGSYNPQTTDSGVRYVVGGVGEESEQTMKQHASEYSLHVLTISGKAYVSMVDVTIMDAKGNTVLDTSMDGSMLYADLKPGTYTVKGTLDGASTKQKTRISKKGSETVRLNFPKADQ